LIKKLNEWHFFHYQFFDCCPRDTFWHYTQALTKYHSWIHPLPSSFSFIPLPPIPGIVSFFCFHTWIHPFFIFSPKTGLVLPSYSPVLKTITYFC
jgi:hypothetical protein